MVLKKSITERFYMKNKSLIALAIIVLSIPGVVYGQMYGQMEKNKTAMDGQRREMMSKKMGMMGSCPMMCSMMAPTVTATSDGGIIIVAGNKITKYDAALTMVNEVERKIDREAMQKMMDSMGDLCPMMDKSQMNDVKDDASESIKSNN
jgi:hypothetical protein